MKTLQLLVLAIFLSGLAACATPAGHDPTPQQKANARMQENQQRLALQRTQLRTL